MTRRKTQAHTFDHPPAFEPFAGLRTLEPMTVSHGPTCNWTYDPPMPWLLLNYPNIESSAQQQDQPLYRDDTPVLPSFFARNGNIEPESSNNTENSTCSKPQQHPNQKNERKSQHATISASTTGILRSEITKSASRNRLLPEPPILRRDQHEIVEIKTISSKRRVEPLVGAVQPVSARNVLRSNIRRPKYRDSPVKTLAHEQTNLCGVPDRELEPEPLKETLQTCQVNEPEKITECLADKFYVLQQQSLKAIAKAWIKAICPKKQAHYPYSNKRKRTGTEPDSIPPWWPPLHLCRYKEPDHVYGVERVNLLIHLIRLRPSQADIISWGKAIGSTELTSVLQPCGGWANCLKTLTPITIFSAITREPQSKVERRPSILSEIFEVADKEEQLLIGGIDGTTAITWVPHPEARPKTRVCISEHGFQDAYDAYDSVTANESVDGDNATLVQQQKTVKRLKKEVMPEKDDRVEHTKARKGGKAKIPQRKIAVYRTASPSSIAEIPARTWRHPERNAQLSSALQSSSQQFDSSTSTSLTTSLDSNSPTDSIWSKGWYEPRKVAPLANFNYNTFRQYDEPKDNIVYDLTQPRFTPMPLVPYSCGAPVDPSGYQPSTPLKEEPTEDLIESTIAPWLNEGIRHTPAPQIGFHNRHGSEHRLATPAALAESRMALSDRWRRPLFDTTYVEQIAMQSDPRLVIMDPLATPVAKHTEQQWNSAQNPQRDRPHGLPSNYWAEEFIDYEAADATSH